jgi:pimeloyl-ACP methyl ester carboxylesterase
MIPSGLVSIPFWTMFLDLLLPLLAYRLSPSQERLQRVLYPMFLDHPIPEDVLEITQAVFEHVHIEVEMPRNVFPEELSSFKAPVLVLAAEHDHLFPADKVVARAQEVFQNLVAAEIIPDCPHFVPERFLPVINKRIDRFLTESI